MNECVGAQQSPENSIQSERKDEYAGVTEIYHSRAV